jgi:hypothetical protein
MAGNDPLRQLRKLVSALAAADPASVGQEAVKALVTAGEDFCAADHAPDEAHGVWEVALSLWCALPAARTAHCRCVAARSACKRGRSARIRFLNRSGPQAALPTRACSLALLTRVRRPAAAAAQERVRGAQQRCLGNARQ